MPTTNGLPAVVLKYEDATPTDARLVARAMSLHELFMKTRPAASPPTRIEVMRDTRDGDVEVRMYDQNDGLAARYRWESESDNMRKVASHDQSKPLPQD
jgi:hypothetical protein